jgi:hypothetical protein
MDHSGVEVERNFTLLKLSLTQQISSRLKPVVQFVQPIICDLYSVFQLSKTG